jgi:Variant SH3 domain
MREISMQARVVRDYRTQYTTPIRFARGEVVTLGERDTEWPAFIWTITADGNAGWAPFDWLRPLDDGRAEALRDYSAQELDVDTGDTVTLHHALGGWWWCERTDGHCGWVPMEHIESNEQDQRTAP